MEERNNRRKLFLIVSLFAIFYSLISLVNHYCFRTYALDLGLYTNALYDYAHLQWNDSSVFKKFNENLLADHFDFYLIAFSPFSYLFGTYTLLILQIFFVLLGGVGVNKVVYLYTSNSRIALWATVYFYCFFGVIAPLSYDYHSNVVAATLLPWFLYFFHQRKILKSALVFLAILLGKENMALWMIFVCLGLMINYKEDTQARKFLLYHAAFALLYFILVIFVVMPKLSNQAIYVHFDYDCLGQDFSSAILFLISHPIDALQLLFVNHSGNPDADYVKLEAYILLLITGIYLLFLKPQYLLMLLPIFLQKMYHNNMQMWSVITHYCIEFAPVLAIGISCVLHEMKVQKTKNIFIAFVLLGCIVASFRVMDNTLISNDRERLKVYVPNHYRRNYDIQKVHEEINKIPHDAVISAQSPFLAHLALRDKIYQFPILKDADFIVYSFDEQPYPLSKDEFKKLTDDLIVNGNWTIQFKRASFVVLKRSR